MAGIRRSGGECAPSRARALRLRCWQASGGEAAARPRAQGLDAGRPPGGVRAPPPARFERVGAPLRQLAADAGVGLGTAAAVMDDLAVRGHLTPPGAGEVRLLDVRRLAEEWTILYPMRLRPKLVRGRYAAADAAWWEAAALAPGRAVFGGEVAADRMTGQLKPARVTVYAWGAPGEISVANRLRRGCHGRREPRLPRGRGVP